jgi:hypothetical protein
MPAVTLSEAAQALGFKSRSTLYRLRDAGDLADYLRPPSSPGGAQLLELTPPGRPPLAEHVNRCIRPQANNEARHRRPRIDPRWGTVAGVLTEALAGCGGLSLCDAEAQAIAAALPAALGEAFGADGLEALRVALADLGCWLAGPGTPEHPEAEREWWNEWGRWEPDSEPLENGPFWENVGGIAGGMMGGIFHGMSGPTAAELHHQMRDAIDEVGRGARWDAARWDAGSARLLLLDDDEVAAGTCPHSLPELQRLAAGGLLPPDLQALADAALQRYRENDQQAAQALPVVVS